MTNILEYFGIPLNMKYFCQVLHRENVLHVFYNFYSKSLLIFLIELVYSLNDIFTLLLKELYLGYPPQIQLNGNDTWPLTFDLNPTSTHGALDKRRLLHSYGPAPSVLPRPKWGPSAPYLSWSYLTISSFAFLILSRHPIQLPVHRLSRNSFLFRFRCTCPNRRGLLFQIVTSIFSCPVLHRTSSFLPMSLHAMTLEWLFWLTIDGLMIYDWRR